MITYYVTFALQFKSYTSDTQLCSLFIDMDEMISYRQDLDKLKERVYEVLKEKNEILYNMIDGIRITSFSLLNGPED